MKFCVNCKYYFPKHVNAPEKVHVCAHSSAMYADRVFGWIPTSASVSREYGPCGPSAKFYKENEK